MENAQKIWDCLTAAGLTPAGAAGLIGNLYAESGLKPDNLQNSFEKKLGYSNAGYTKAVDCGTYDGFVNDGAGYGLAQWTYASRKAALLAYTKAQGRSVGDLEAQLGYLLQELQSLFPAVWTALRRTASVTEATVCVLVGFERPADQSAAAKARRAGYAQMFYDKFVGGECDNMTYYRTVQDVPSYYQGAVKKAMDKGALNGTGKGEINVSEDLCRTLTVLDRLGKLD